MLSFIELEGFFLIVLAICILYKSRQPEKGLWRITASRVEKLKD